LEVKSYKYQGWLLNLLSSNEKLFLPFICQKCGKCCREIGIEQSYFDPFKIADYLRKPVKEVVEEYLGTIVDIDEDNVHYEITKPKKPCVFLEPYKCKIYPIRPISCGAYPHYGDSGIGCPSKIALRDAAKKVGRGHVWTAALYLSDDEPQTEIKRRKWRKHLGKYLSSQPDPEALEMFTQLNNFEKSKR
jgi:Fe-S-cluster containining protein